MKKYGVLLVALVVIAGIWWGYAASPLAPSVEEQEQESGLQTIVLTGPNGQLSIAVEVANTPETRAQGLMERISLANGMLFVFDIPQVQTFWMKDTLIPLDIVFFDSNGVFVNSARMLPCTGSPCPVYSSSAPALFALEMTAGFLEQSQVGAGWKMKRL